jgi:hypothetical protein
MPEYLPALQLTHTVEPDDAEYLPATQSTQTLGEVAVVVVENLP